jgi:hypothetical protein
MQWRPVVFDELPFPEKFKGCSGPTFAGPWTHGPHRGTGRSALMAWDAARGTLPYITSEANLHNSRAAHDLYGVDARMQKHCRTDTSLSVSTAIKGENTMRPRYARIPEAMNYGGESRTGLYRKATLNPGLFVKDGRRTFVDMVLYDEILDKRPKAVIKVKSLNDDKAA